MAASHDESDAGGCHFEPGDDGRRIRMTAIGADPETALGAAINGLLGVAYLDITHRPSEDDATTALPLRAESADLADLFRNFASSLLDEIDHAEYAVRAVRIDGVRRTDEGLRGWGYALAVSGQGTVTPMAIDDAVAHVEPGRVTIRATLTKAAT